MYFKVTNTFKSNRNHSEKHVDVFFSRLKNKTKLKIKLQKMVFILF